MLLTNLRGLHVALRLSGICQSEMAITAAASGRLMKNTQRHEACSTSQPPRTGPTAVVIAVKPDQVPMRLPRLFSSKDVLINRQTAGHEERSANALNASRDDQLIECSTRCRRLPKPRRKSRYPRRKSDGGQTSPRASRRPESTHRETARKTRPPIAHPRPFA